MTRKLGVYWSVMHRRPQDYAFFKRLQPSAFKIMDGGPPDYQWARENLPDSLVIARDWALSEQHSDMLKDPQGTGRRHAREWHEHQAHLGFDRAKTLILGINEPRIWEGNVSQALREYTIALCDEATKYGLRVGAMQLSVGWPNNKGPDTPPDWSPWHGVDVAIRGNNGALVCHEYWADQGPSENWGWWGGRSLKCPWDVPIVIGECGVDMFVKDSSVNADQRGWRGRKSPERYATELADYVGRMSADSRFVGCTVFAADFASHEWYSFDIEPAYNAILATPIPEPQPPEPTPPGNISVGEVYAEAGLNVRSGPGTEYEKLGALANGSTVLYDDAQAGWLHIIDGWVSDDYVGAPTAHDTATQPTPAPDAPAPAPSSDCWQRAMAFVKRWEGGFANDPNDPGGATNKGITIDTYTRWRKAHGQPQPTVEELRNLSDEEAERIFYEWYWLASGADKLAYPLCLIQFDTAVNAGVGRAQEMLDKSNGDFLTYASNLIDWYTRIPNFEHFGRAWIRRRADLLLEAST